MTIGIPKESFPGERRVALTPASVLKLVEAGHEILIESEAGEGAGYTDQDFKQTGASIVPSRNKLFASAQVVLQVLALSANPPAGLADLELMSPAQVLIAFLRPFGNKENLMQLAQSQVTAFAIELLPRITRAQPMDALSSMSTVAGYKAVLSAADFLPKMFPMLITAGGTIKPARIFVIGAGVLGLQAIATARRLGAVVQAYDVRPAVKEEVESLGARFVELPLETSESKNAGTYATAKDEVFYRRQQDLLTEVVAQCDVVIASAVVRGRKAPVLITEAMIRKMAPGSVIMDLAGERGGNCALAEAGKTVVRHGVTIASPINIASSVAVDASQMYAKNVSAFLRYLFKAGELRLDMEDEILSETLVTHMGKVVNPRIREFFEFPM
jgi:proton-translocating NAD(P)+ transhydrogenase subunit alpha